MRERRRATINELRTAVECLPRHTRIAMLEGIRTNEIIVGAYTNDGGICPMLAAHRAGGRTDFFSFAKAWDWSWMRVVRRLDDYERALARLEAAADEPGQRTTELV